MSYSTMGPRDKVLLLEARTAGLISQKCRRIPNYAAALENIERRRKRGETRLFRARLAADFICFNLDRGIDYRFRNPPKRVWPVDRAGSFNLPKWRHLFVRKKPSSPTNHDNRQ